MEYYFEAANVTKSLTFRMLQPLLKRSRISIMTQIQVGLTMKVLLMMMKWSTPLFMMTSILIMNVKRMTFLTLDWKT